MNDSIFQLLAIIIFVAAASISIHHCKKADQAGGEKISLKDEGLPILMPYGWEVSSFGFPCLPI